MKNFLFYALALCFCLLFQVFCHADPHPPFTAKSLREKSDLIVVCRIIEIVRVDRDVDSQIHQKAYDIIVEVEDLLKGNANKSRISIAHLRQTFANKPPIDFGEQINERLAQLDLHQALDISKDRVFLLAYLRKPTHESTTYTPSSTNDWESYSLHVLSGRFN